MWNEETRVGVAILARAPVAGQAKTRLIPALGAVGAAALQDWMIGRALQTARAAGLGPVTLWLDGEIQAVPDDIAVRRQPDGDLGARLLAAIAARPGTRVMGTLVIGTDGPALTPDHLRAAATSLRRHDAVVIPAEDGGYVLIGMNQPCHAVFDHIAWGTDRVMAQTRERLRIAGLTWHEPATLWDVDRPEDLPRLFAMCPDAGMVVRQVAVA